MTPTAADARPREPRGRNRTLWKILAAGGGFGGGYAFSLWVGCYSH